MKALHLILVAGLLLAVRAYPQPAPDGRFEAVDVFVDSGDVPLAAYQFELAAEVGQITIVGIEGGDPAAFKEAPYYDPAALNRQHRIIVAAFSTARDLPKGVTRVARVHVYVTGDTEPQYVVALKVAASADGERIPATASATASRGEAQ
jgi:hypothetical protein